MKTPQRLGKWEVLASIAQGGQGAVLRARDTETGSPVALKLLLKSDGKALRRFKQEAQVLERLAHPGIVRVLGHGDEDGVPWLAMALVEGETLRGRVEREGPLEPLEAARIVAALARAVAHAHEQGVVHRDLKPENVIMEKASGRPILVDFGLLRRDAEVFGELSIDAHSRLSKTGELRGTPAFMAPEQVSPGRFGGIGPGTDVYGLGGVLFYLLTGKPPHEADGLPGLIYQILESTTSPDPSIARPALPGPIVTEVRRALSPEPAERHPSANALADALERVAAGGGGDPRPRRLFLVGLALATLVAAGGIAVGARLVRREEPATSVVSPGAGSKGAAPISTGADAPTDEARRREDAARDLAALGAGTAAERVARASAWLSRFGGLPGEARARDVLREAGHDAPLLTFTPDPVPGNLVLESRALWLDDARFVTWGHGHGLVRVWSADQPRPLLTLDLGGTTDDLALSAPGATDTREVVALRDGLARLSLTAGSEPRRIQVDLLPRANIVGCGRDGRVALGDAEGQVLVISPNTPDRLLPAAHASPIRCIRFSDDGRWLATSSGRSFVDIKQQEPDNLVVLWDARTLERVASVEITGQPVVLAFSPDVRWLAAGTSSYRLFVIDLRAPGGKATELEGQDTGERTVYVRRTAHGGAVRGLTFLPDGLLRSGSGEVAASGAELGLRTWDPAAKKELHERARRLASGVVSLDARPDGRLLVGQWDGTITVWGPW